jgi:hypothetical protein
MVICGCGSPGDKSENQPQGVVGLGCPDNLRAAKIAQHGVVSCHVLISHSPISHYVLLSDIVDFINNGARNRSYFFCFRRIN